MSRQASHSAPAQTDGSAAIPFEPPLALNVLGAFELVGKSASPVNLSTDKTRALLAYLAVEPPQPHRREILAGLLWPQMDTRAALSNLRLTLHRLRQALGLAGAADTLVITRQTVQLGQGGAAAIHIDVRQFQALLAACAAHPHSDIKTCPDCLIRLSQAARLYRGELLAGFGFFDAPDFEEWLLLRRETLEQQALATLTMLIDAHEQTGNDLLALDYANQLLALDPLHEDAHRRLMQIWLRRGQPDEALAQFERCRRVLSQELGVEPDVETHLLYEQIRAAMPSATNPLASALPGTTERAVNSLVRDWSDAPDEIPLFGRQTELTKLTDWLVDDQCRLIMVLGIGGVGKTALTAAAAHAAESQFHTVLWRSLLNAPPIEETLQVWLQHLFGRQRTDIPTHLDAQLDLLLTGLREQRCLLVLDNVESILMSDQAGKLRPGYEGYAQLLQRVAEHAHQSILALTSRERPTALTRHEAPPQSATSQATAQATPLTTHLSRVRVLALDGLDADASQAMLSASGGLWGSEEATLALVQRYSGHPLALKLVAQTVHQLFGGDIAAFLSADALIFDDIRDVLDHQFERLSRLERDILIWLAIEREPATFQTLSAEVLESGRPREFLEALRALQRRSLINLTANGFALQNVILEYATERLIDAISQDLTQADAGIASTAWTHSALNRFAVLKARAKDYVRISQERLIVQPVAARMAARFGEAGVVAQLKHILRQLHGALAQVPGYAAGNILNLLLHLKADPRGLDFSGLSVWQAYLQESRLTEINFRGADLTNSIFTHIFGEVFNVQFDRAGQLLVAGLIEGKMAVWRTDQGQSLREYQILGTGATIANFSPDGSLLASGHTDHTAQVWDVKTGRQLHKLVKHSQTPWCLIFRPDNHMLITSGADGAIHVWDLNTGQILRSLHGHTAAVPALAISRDGRRLASGDVDGVACVWSLDDVLAADAQVVAQPAHILHGHTEEIHGLTFDGTGTLLASGSHDRTIRIWNLGPNLEHAETLHVLEGHSRVIRTMALSPDGHTLASGGGDTFVCVWDLRRAGPPLHTFLEMGKPGASMAFSPDGTRLAVGAVEQRVSLLDVVALRPIERLQAYSNRLYALDFMPNGNQLVSGGTDYLVRLWDIASQADSTADVKRDARPTARLLQGHTNWIHGVAASADGRLIASASDDGTVRLWNAQGSALPPSPRHTDRIECVAFSPDGHTLISGGSQSVLDLWDVRAFRADSNASSETRRQPRHMVLGGHTERIFDCRFNPQGDLIASGSADRTVRIWDVQAAQVKHVLHGHTNGVKCVAFSPDGRRLVSGGFDHTLRFWDVATGQLQTILSPHAATIVSVAFSEEGNVLAVACGDHTVRLVDMQTERVICVLRGHMASVECVRFSPDGRVLASAGSDEVIRLWDAHAARDGQALCLRTLVAEGPYARMDITDATGISPAQKEVLMALGAIIT